MKIIPDKCVVEHAVYVCGQLTYYKNYEDLEYWLYVVSSLTDKEQSLKLDNLLNFH
jgi:hypothetical protein